MMARTLALAQLSILEAILSILRLSEVTPSHSFTKTHEHPLMEERGSSTGLCRLPSSGVLGIASLGMTSPR